MLAGIQKCLDFQWLLQGMFDGITKIALGHHRDDIVETLFLNMFFGGGQVYLLQLADLLRERADLFAFCINPKVAKLLEERGVKSISYPWALNASKPLHMLLALWICLRFRLFNGVNVVWANGIPDIIVMPFARLLGCTAFATRHLTLEIETLDWYRGIKRRAAEWLYRTFAGTAPLSG